MLKVAMIGAGGYAHQLMKYIWEIPEKIKLLAVRSSPKRQSCGTEGCKNRGIPIYSEIDKMLEDLQGKADVIIVPTPIQTHFALAKKCLEAGFDVFLEKPPVVTIQDHDKLLEIAKAKGKQIPVMFQCLYSNILHQLQKRIIAGKFGRLKCIKGTAAWSRPDSYFTRSSWSGKIKIENEWILDGTINNPLAHMLSNQLYLSSFKLGKMAEPHLVQAELYRANNIDSEDTSSIRIITTDDIELLFNVSLCSEKKCFDGSFITIECERALIEFENYNKAFIHYKDRRTEQIDDTNISQHRIPMLKRIEDSYEKNISYDASLEICRPFTLAVNAAFESSAETYAIDGNYLAKITEDGVSKTMIKGIDDILEKSYTQGKLFSELNIPWAQKTDSFELKDYKQFPISSFQN